MIDVQARMRRNNLLFFGIDESREENCEEKILLFIKEKLGVQEQPVIQRAHRLGKPTPNNVIGSKANRPRPIICLFLDHKQKEAIKSKRFGLKAPFWMADDLPKEIREARKSLQAEVKELKNQGKRVTIAYPCKLICEGKLFKNIDILSINLKQELNPGEGDNNNYIDANYSFNELTIFSFNIYGSLTDRLQNIDFIECITKYDIF